MESSLLTDQFGRVHDYLRISITDACNLRCSYCMPVDRQVTATKELMRADEIFKIAETFVSMGVKKIRLTGGEPLVRKDVDSIMLQLSKLPVELALSTNGVLVDEHIEVLKKAGIRSVNISLDSLQKDRFNNITHRDLYNRVINNIQLLSQQGFYIKLNTVVMRNCNEDEILDFVALTRNTSVHVRFIEFMPFSGNNWTDNTVVSFADILDVVRNKHKIVKLVDGLNDTAKKYRALGHKGTFAVISTMTDSFCGNCNRLRLTADGKMKNCLFDPNELDILTLHRAGGDIKPAIQLCLYHKAAEKGGQNLYQLTKNRSMVAIGG